MQRDIIILRVMTKFTQIPQLLERYLCIGYHYPLGNDQIHSNSSTSRKISMQRDIIILRIITKFTQIPQLLERYLCIGYHYPSGNDQIHSNSSTSRKISMYPNIVTRRVMTKFTQIPQSSEKVGICFKKDTRRNGIMTSLVHICFPFYYVQLHSFSFFSVYICVIYGLYRYHCV